MPLSSLTALSLGFALAIEICDHQIADVHAVRIRVGGEDDLVAAQTLGVVLDVERLHQVVGVVQTSSLGFRASRSIS